MPIQRKLGRLVAGGALLLALAALPAPGAQAAFPGQNGKIAFQSQSAPGSNLQIFVMNANGSGRTPLTSPFDSPARTPAWSPDGTRIAFGRDGPGNFQIWVMNANGSGQTQLTDGAAADRFPAWSPDGQKIAFRSNRDGNSEIYVMNANGSGQTRLTNNGAIDNFPAWSPDGQRIAFQSNRDGGADEIYVMNANGSGQTRLTNNAAFDGQPAWSPDGSKIAFQSERDGNSEIYVMNANGSGQTRLTNNPALDGNPAWSPDGSKIAFNSSRDGSAQIYVMSANGSAQTRLTSTGQDGAPDWQPISACPDVRVGFAVAQGCFERSSPGSALFETRQKAWVGGFEIQPRSGAKLILDTQGRRLVAQGVVDVVFEGVRLPIPVSALPVNVPDATIELNQPGTIEKILFELPMEGSARVAWADGGKSSTFEGELKLSSLIPDGELVTTSQQEGVGEVGGKLKAKLENGRGFIVEQFEVRIDELNFIPGRLRVPRLVSLRNLLLRFERRNGRPFWTGQAGIRLPLSRGALDVTGRVFVFDTDVAGGGLSVDGINVRIVGPLFLQRVSGDILFRPTFGLELGVGGSLGPRVNGKQLLSIDGTMQGGSAVRDCEAGDDPVKLQAVAKLKPLEPLELGGLAEAELTTRQCTYVGTPAFEGTIQSKLSFANEALSFEGAYVGFISTNGANLEGSSLLRLPLLPDLNGQAIISTRGFAACANLTFFQGGFGYSWGQAGLPTTFSGCDLGPFRVTARASVLRARSAATLRLPRRLPHAGFAATSATGPPRVRVMGPGGFRLTTPAGNGTLRNRRALVVPVAHERTTYVIVNNPRGGTWRVESADPARPLTRVRVARGLPKPRVKARVRQLRVKKSRRKRRGRRSRPRKSAKFRLSYRVTPIPGQRVFFYERGGGIAKRLGRARGRRGSITFKPTLDARRGRRIEAEVIQNGLPRALLTVARFRAPPRPKLTRARIKARRTRSTLTVSWRRVTGASNYLVQVRSTRATLLGPLLTRKRRLLLRRTPRTGNLRVTVQPLSTAQRPGPTARKTVKPAKEKKRQKKRKPRRR